MAKRAVALAMGLVLGTSAWAQESNSAAVPTTPAPSELEVNNKWTVTINNTTRMTAPIFVALRQVDRHWEIAGIYNSPLNVPRNLPIELFMATRDLQRWKNYYLDMRQDCDKFEVRESEFHSVCSSALAEKKTGMAAVGILFGGSGRVGVGYTDAKVQAAINSIRPAQATAMLTNFEQGIVASLNQEQNNLAAQRVESQKDAAARSEGRKSAPIGAKDWCEQTVRYLGIVLEVSPTYTCQNYGVMSEEDMRREGWAITNKQARQIVRAPQVVTVYDLSIEKVPR